MPVTSPARRVRLWSIVTTGCLLLSLIGSGTPRPAVALSSGSVDLAAMVPTVDDLGDVGLDDFYASRSNELRVDEYLALPGLSDANRATIRESGYIGSYHRNWVSDARDDAPGGNGYPTMLVSTGLSQYRDDDGAAVGFRFSSSNGRPIAQRIGDRSLLVEQGQRLGDVLYRDVRIVVQRGALVADVTVSIQDGDRRLDEATSLAESLARRFVHLIDRGVPDGGGLAFATLAFDVAPLGSSESSEYVMLGGAPSTGYSDESPSERADWSGSLTADGVTSLYQSWQTAETDEFAAEDAGYTIYAAAVSFERSRDAIDYQAARARDARDARPHAAHIDLDGLPEGAVAIERANEDQARYDTEILWTVDRTMYEVLLRLPSRFADPKAALAVARVEQRCAHARDCFGAQPIPMSLAADLGPMSYVAPGSVGGGTDKPVPGGGGTPVATPESGKPVPAATTSYASDDFGFSLAWRGSVWTQVNDYEPFFGVEGLRLDHADGGTLFIEVQDSRSARTLAGCVANLSDIVLSEGGVDDVEPALDADGDVIAGESDGLAYAAYEITFGGDDGLDYFACATLADGESAVGFIYITSALDTIERQLADVEAVIASYDVE